MPRISLNVPFFFWLLLTFTVSLQAVAQTKKTYNLVTDFGAKADDRTDNYPAFKRAASLLSNSTGFTLVIPKGKYYIGSYKIHGGAGKNEIDDIVFKNCNALTIEGNNSIIRVNGRFTRKPDYSIPGYSTIFSFNNTVCPFVLSGCRNTVLKNLELYGEADKMKNGGVLEGPSYGISLSDEGKDSSYNILLQNIATHHFASDGILVRSNGNKLTINNCRSYANARQGLSIVKGRDILVYGSDFDSTGFTGGYGFHWPSAGIDIENEFNTRDVSNVVIRKCRLRGNYGFQIVTTLASHNILIDSCFIADKENGYASGVNGVGMYSLNSTISNCIIFGSIQIDLGDQIYKGEKIQQIRNNIIYSGHRGLISADFNRPVNIDGNILIMLPKPENTYFPYIQNGSCTFNNNIIVMNPERIGTGIPQVTSLVQIVKEGKNNFWLLNKNNFTEAFRKGYHYYLAAFNGAKTVEKQFFPSNEFTKAMEMPEKRFITDNQMEKIISASLFSAFKQNTFNRSYLVQANEARAYAAGIAAASR